MPAPNRPLSSTAWLLPASYATSPSRGLHWITCVPTEAAGSGGGRAEVSRPGRGGAIDRRILRVLRAGTQAALSRAHAPRPSRRSASDPRRDVFRQHPVKGIGAVDVLAQRLGEKVAVEIETGKSDTKENLTKIAHADFDRIVLVATSPAGSEACRKAMAAVTDGPPVQLLTWLDVS